MQILHPGDVVRARQHRWRVVDVRAYDACQVVRLLGFGESNLGVERGLLAPFDTIEPIECRRRPRFVRATKWRRACRAILAASGPPGGLRAITHARIDLLPPQLEPALAVIRGKGSRVLLADEVGLGKTIQAGILLAELRARGAADRVLILTPAGLREQWAEELSARFGIDAEVVDFRRVRQGVATVPVGVNPWGMWPLAIASIDYVKRPEVLRAVLACSWDVVVIDEAHGVTGDSDRHAAVAALASQAAYVVSLTATPHNGDSAAFQSLCSIGAHDDGLLVFRRTRNATTRRIHHIAVRPSPAERRMYALVAEFSRAVREERGDASRDVWLALAVLHKRALSSAHSLARSVARRLSTLSENTVEAGQQLALPLDDHGESDVRDQEPAWLDMLTLRDVGRERRLLTLLADAAAAASARETKLSALVRLLGRISEPVVVFTEYRDTLLHVASMLARPVAILHGGLSRQERVRALQAFRRGGQIVLLATDAGGEGLNLHHCCRTVINLELPWNPMRLEQRIGRVDRIGQRRTIHAFHLIAAGTGEERLLARLRDRIASAQADIGSPNPLGDVDHLTARFLIGHIDAPLLAAHVPMPLATEPDAWPEAARLKLARALGCRDGTPSRAQLEGGGPWVVTARNRSTRARLGARIVCVWQVAIEDGCGRVVESAALATAIALSRFPALCGDLTLVEELIRSAEPELIEEIRAASSNWTASAILHAKALVAARLARARAIGADTPAHTDQDAFQPGLFDHRAYLAQEVARRLRQETADLTATRISLLERCLEVSPVAPKLLLVIVP